MHRRKYAIAIVKISRSEKLSTYPAALWFPRALRLPPIDPFQQHRQLRSCQSDRTAGRLRPDEAAALQPLLEQTQSVTIPPQQLDQVAPLAAEDEHMPGERRLLKHRLDQRVSP